MSGITPLVRLPLQLELGVEGCGEGAASPGPRAGGSILGRPSKPQSGMIYTFEDFELDTDRYELRQAGAPLAVEPQVFDVLLYLVEHGDRVVTKQELFENVWKTGS